MKTHSRLLRPSPGLTRDVFRAVSSPPRLLPPAERSFFESRLGQDFSQVRVHTGEAAAATAAALGARAFAMGNDIVFADGRYDPASEKGQRLLAHELVHVAQQRRGGSTAAAAEPQARAAAERVTRGEAVSAQAQGEAPAGIYGDADDDKKKRDEAVPAPAVPVVTPSAAGDAPSPSSLKMPPLGAAGLSMSTPYQLTPPLGLPPTYAPFPALPPPALTPPLFPPAGPNIDWLKLRGFYETRGVPMSDRDADSILQTWDSNAQLLTNLGITDRFKFLFITKEWILNKGISKQVEDQQARENPNAVDLLNKEWKQAYPGGFETPQIPIFDIDWFRSKKKK